MHCDPIVFQYNYPYLVFPKLIHILQNVIANCWFLDFYIFHQKYMHRILDDF